ncbi:MAG: amidase [Alphaproteobacteria bacterium]|nr:amidase [Alphaproteobacteria bacterium]
MADLTDLTLTEVADRIARREVTSRAVTEACVARIDRLQPEINAFLLVDGDRALAAADAADRALAAGRWLGSLHGVPLAHKDLFYRAGRVTTCGSRIRRYFVPEVTATVLARLDAAGAVDLGTLNMSEFAMGPAGDNVHYGPARNPWARDRIAGGSSSGSGAAVGARLVYGALGSDTAGSIRVPAFCNGIAGLKPTQTRISRAGVMPLSHSLDNAGPMARTVRDCARLTTVIAGRDAADPTTADVPVGDYEQEIDRGVQGLRIGLPGNYFGDGLDADVERLVTAAGLAFRDLGATLVPLAVPDLAPVSDATALIINVEGAAIHGEWMRTRPQDYSPEIRSRLELGYHHAAVEYADALRLRGRVLEEFTRAVFGKVDLLLTPGMLRPTPRLAEVAFTDAGGLPAFMAAMTRCTRPINYLGLPALSVPCGFMGDGLPAGIQLVGRPFAEALLFRAGHTYEQAAGWHLKAPPL